MQKGIYRNILSSVLIACLIITGSIVPTSLNDHIYAEENSSQHASKPTKAKVKKSEITVPATTVTGKKFSLILTGDRQNEKGVAEGDTRFIPLSYVIDHSNGKIKSPKKLKKNKKGLYSYSIKFTVAGKKKIEVTWREQQFTGGKWKNVSKKKTKKTITVRKGYKVTLKGNGGKVSKKSITVAKGKKYNSYQALPNPTRKGYNFTGWYTKKKGGKKIKATTKVSLKSKQTLYARWKNKYTVTFNANGGKISNTKKTKSVTLAKSYGALPVPTKSNQSFLGWNTAKAGNGIFISKQTLVSLKKNQTLYAIWGETGDIIGNYDNTAKSIISRIGKQGKSQCAVYCMSYCTAIKDKRQVAPTSYLLGDLAYWVLGGMTRFKYSSTTASHNKAMNIVKSQIDINLPCIIRTNYNSTGQHWLVVVGYEPNATSYPDLYVLDPAASDVTQVFLLGDTKYYFPKDGDVGVVTY